MPNVIVNEDTTVSYLVEETRRHLLGGFSEQLTALAANLATTTETSVVLDDAVRGLGEGSIFEVGREVFYVRSWDETTKTATVFRGHGRSEGATHNIGDIVRINPSFTTDEIFHTVISEFAALKGSALVRFVTTEVSPTTSLLHYDSGLDPADEPLYIQHAEYEYDARGNWKPAKVQLVTDLDTSDFASGYAIKVTGGGVVGRPLRVTFACTLKVPSSMNDVISEAETGHTVDIWPAIPVGAAWRLLLGKEARRLNPDRSHGSRRAEEVSPGSIAFLGRAFQRMREDIIESALERQYAKHPPRTRV